MGYHQSLSLFRDIVKKQLIAHLNACFEIFLFTVSDVTTVSQRSFFVMSKRKSFAQPRVQHQLMLIICLIRISKEDRSKICRQWINFVKTKRKDFITPTMHSVLCEKHFTADCYSTRNVNLYISILSYRACILSGFPFILS